MTRVQYVVWNDNYSVKVVSLDDQHKKILELINDIYNAKRQNQADSKVSHALLELRDYSITHLSDEESLLKKCGYSDFEIHKKVHDDFRKESEQLLRMQRDIMGDISIEVLDFLKAWWTKHILGMDQKYVQCVTVSVT